jgi:hypothetical protein
MHLHKEKRRKIINIDIADDGKYLNHLSVGYEGRSITTTFNVGGSFHVA